MSDPAKDPSLTADSTLDEVLTRVAYQPGMLLGLEATRAEQDFHRRRLTRHHYWLHGHGTVCGLAVLLQADAPPDDDSDTAVRLVISPGIGIDGLGREITVAEPYCIDLREWLALRLGPDAAGGLLTDGLDGDRLWLKVSMRYQDCPAGLQPVLARQVNAGTDPVQPARLKDGVLFELIPEVPPPDAGEARPWPGQRSLPPLDQVPLTASETAWSGAQDQVPERELELAGQRIYAWLSASGQPRQDALDVTPYDPDSSDVTAYAAQLARTLLARIEIPLRPDGSPVINRNRIGVNNLVRPMVPTPDQLQRLIRQLLQEAATS